MYSFFYDSCENLDACIFTGSGLDNDQDREVFKSFLDKWNKEFQKTEEEKSERNI